MSTPDYLLSLDTHIGQLAPTWSVHPGTATRDDVAALAAHVIDLRAELHALRTRVAAVASDLRERAPGSILQGFLTQCADRLDRSL